MVAKVHFFRNIYRERKTLENCMFYFIQFSNVASTAICRTNALLLSDIAMLVRGQPLRPRVFIKVRKNPRPTYLTRGEFFLSDVQNKSIRMSFRVTPQEREIIELRMKQAKKKTAGAYVRKMAISGVIVNYENEEIKKLVKSISGIQTNINQIAMRANLTNRVYNEDIEYMKKVLQEIWQSLNSVQSSLQFLSQ